MEPTSTFAMMRQSFLLSALLSVCVIFFVSSPIQARPPSRHARSVSQCSYLPSEGNIGHKLTDLFIAKLRRGHLDPGQTQQERNKGLEVIFKNLEALHTLTPYPFLQHIQAEEILNYSRTSQFSYEESALAKWDGIFESKTRYNHGEDSDHFSVLTCTHKKNLFPPVFCEDTCSSCHKRARTSIRQEVRIQVSIMAKKSLRTCDSSDWRNNWHILSQDLKPLRFIKC